MFFPASLPQNERLQHRAFTNIKPSDPRLKFDKAYYDRYYRNPATRAVTPAAARRQAGFIASYLRHLEIPVRRLIDIGCGTGTVLRALARKFPAARTEGVEYSSYLCQRYGWTMGSVETHKARAPADLVVCNDVLGYLDDAACARAIENLARLCDGALFLGVLTLEDLALCDIERTDSNQQARAAAWYRRRLNRHFLNVGGGLYLKRPLNVTVWTLDRM